MRMKCILIGAVLALGVTTALSDTLKDGTIEDSAGHYLAGEAIPVGYDLHGPSWSKLAPPKDRTIT